MDVDRPTTITEEGIKRWFTKEEGYHRENGPAIITSKTEYYLINNQRHRIDGPAIIRKNLQMEWWIRDNLHREDGPAIIRKNGETEWWINGYKISNEWIEENISNVENITDGEKVLMKLRWAR